MVLIGTAIGALVGHFMRLSHLQWAGSVFRRRIFGLLRGLVIIGLFVILCHALRLTGEPWWRGSMLMPYAEHAANVLRGMVGERKIQVGHPVTHRPYTRSRDFSAAMCGIVGIVGHQPGQPASV